MKRRVFKKISLLLLFTLLFCSLPVHVVHASNVQSDSSPIFGITPEQVIDKYNSLTSSQKAQVNKALGNSTIFANSLFGNVINTSFGLIDDAVTKLGDLFFRANGVVYHLGSSALSWVYRLIDKIFNNDLYDLNISQPVVNDIYLNTRDLVYSGPSFVNNNYPKIFSEDYKANFSSIFPLKYENASFAVDSFPNVYSSEFGNILNSSKENLLVDLNNHAIYIGALSIRSILSDGSALINFINPSFSQMPIYMVSCYYNPLYDISTSWIYSSSYEHKVLGTFSGMDYYNSLVNVLYTYFVSVSTFIVVEQDHAEFHYIDSLVSSYNVTDNTSYQYIYNIPQNTILNVNNIVSNTAIYYQPVQNIVNYLPDNYDIEQNFQIVYNYYYSTGSSISTQGSIDVNLVSPSVIDVRVINPDDFNFDIDILNQYDFDVDGLNLTGTVNLALDTATQGFSNVSTSSISFLGGFFNIIPGDIMAIVIGYIVLAFVIIALNLATHKGGS